MPAAATSSARLACACPFTRDGRSGEGGPSGYGASRKASRNEALTAGGKRDRRGTGMAPTRLLMIGSLLVAVVTPSCKESVAPPSSNPSKFTTDWQTHHELARRSSTRLAAGSLAGLPGSNPFRVEARAHRAFGRWARVERPIP